MPTEIISVNVGLPQDVVYKQMTVRTAIFKQPVEGPVKVAQLNLAGDQQADLTVHGGTDKAVYGYPAEHYEYWRNQLPDAQFSWGNFGENLTTTGLREDTLFVGDRLRVGSALLMVTQPRMPCYKLGVRFQRDDMVKRFLASRRNGFYFSVVEEGEVSKGSPVELLSRDPERVSVANIISLYVDHQRDRELLERALRVNALPQSWKVWFRERARASYTDQPQ